MPVDPEPRAHVASTEDFYALLSVSPEDLTEEVLKKAYRRGSLRYHPDKAVKQGASEAEKERARDRWDLFEVARKLLGDAELRAQYDNARAAREHRRKRDAAHDDLRRRMLDRLESREKGDGDPVAGLKRGAGSFDEDDSAREVRRLATDGARMREALLAKRRAHAQAAKIHSAEKFTDEESQSSTPRAQSPSQASDRTKDLGTPPPQTSASVPEASTNTKDIAPGERTIKVRFPSELSDEIDSGRLERVFARFGPIDSVVMGQTKKERLRPDQKRKQLLGRGYIQFVERQSAVEAIERWQTILDDSMEDWIRDLDVSWLLKGAPADTDTHFRTAPSVPTFALSDQDRGRSTANSPGIDGDKSGKSRSAPSFGSFKSSASTVGSGAAPSGSSGSKLFQETVMAKMRNAAATAAASNTNKGSSSLGNTSQDEK